VALCCLTARGARGEDGSLCEGDFNGDQRVTIDEIVRAVNNALYGCPGPPGTPSTTTRPSRTATRTPPASVTPTRTVPPTGTQTASATHTATQTATATRTGTPVCVPEEEVCNGHDDDCDCPGDTNEDEVTCGPGDEGVDEGGVCGPECPAEMVAIGAELCMDRYEASRPDADAEQAGTNESVATSRAGVLPWMVNPMNAAHLTTFQAACAAAGKHLCTREEWLAACTGPPPGTSYVYGNTFDRETCNCVDTFCDDYCEDHGIPPGSCSTAANCGYTYSCFRVAPTGSFPQCTNEYGTFDVSGNVWEVVPSADDGRGYEVRGGAFNCASAAARLRCTYNATWNELYAGFRCCGTPR